MFGTGPEEMPQVSVMAQSQPEQLWGIVQVRFSSKFSCKNCLFREIFMIFHAIFRDN